MSAIHIVEITKPGMDGWFQMTLEYNGKRASYRTKQDPTPEELLVIEREITTAQLAIGILGPAQ